MANARLNVAEYRLSLLGHWTTCGKCNSGQHCSELSLIPVPTPMSERELVGKNSDHIDSETRKEDSIELLDIKYCSEESFEFPKIRGMLTFSRDNSCGRFEFSRDGSSADFLESMP